jgi:hypothetical protein
MARAKPGVKTTEFWVGLVMPQIFALLVAFGVFTPDQATGIQSDIVSAVVASKELIAAIISGVSAAGYNIGRGLAKTRNE